MSESPEASQRSGTNRSSTEGLGRLEREDRRVNKVDRRVASTVKQMARDLQELASAAEDEAVGQLLAATARVDGETTQSGILTTLLDESRRFASRTAFFLTRPGEVRGWAGRGFSGVERAQLDYEEGSVWARIASQIGTVSLSAEESTAVCRGLEAPAGGPGVLIPFTLRGQLGGVLYADRLESEGALGIASLQLLTHSAAQSVETAALRRDGGSPALHFSSETSPKTTLWQPQPPQGGSPAPEATISAPEATDESPASEAATPEASTSAIATGAAATVGAVAAAAGVAAAAAGVVAEPVEETPPVAEEVSPVAEEPEEAVLAEEDPVEATNLDEVPTGGEVATETSPEIAAEDAEAVDFEMVTEAEEERQAVEDIEAELDPEPELEDTSDLWAVEEEEEEEATLVDQAPVAEPVMEQPPVVMPPEVGQETVRLDIAALQGQMPTAPTAPTVPITPPVEEEETAKLPQWEVEAAPDPVAQEFELEAEEEPAKPLYDVEPEASEPVTAALPVADFSEDATIISPPPSTSPMEGGYVPPAPEPESTEIKPPADMAPSTEVTPPPSSGFAAPPSKGDASGTSQVVPPTDIQGPGSAFGTTAAGAIPEGEEALHEEARRLARLLVSEIKLYNEEIIEEGRRSGNIYDRLKDDIDRSRQMYAERIDPRLLEGDHDYFRLELIQRLAGGDEQLLGY